MAFPLAAIGIGALLGGLTEKQRGGNFLKGAITGGALGGITGGIGSKFAQGKFFGNFGGAHGLFGLGKGYMKNLLPMAGIGMASEMMGQESANQRMLAGRQRLFDEEEERRISRLNDMAGYDVSKARLTPETFFMASGGLTNLPEYANGGWARKGYEYGGEVEEMEMASAPHPMEGYVNMYDDLIGSGEFQGSFEEFMEMIRDSDMDIPMAARGGRIHAKDGQYINEEDGGFEYDIDVDGNKYDFSFDEELTEEGLDSFRKRLDIRKMMEGMFDDEGNFIGDPGMMFDPSNEDGTITTMGPDGNMVNAKPMAQGGRIHAKDGLWANIHAKRARIKAGSGEKMRSPGSAGAPTNKALRQSQATGGIADLDMRYGGESMGPGTGTSDDVPAMLSDGEFVVTAKAVEQLGGGDRMEGAKRMYSMMNNLDPASQKPGEMEYVGHG